MTIKTKVKLSTIMKSVDPETYKILRFLFYSAIIFATYMTSAVLTQKIYKTPYLNNNAKSSEDPNSFDYFSNPFGITLFDGFFALCYGFFMYEIVQHNSDFRAELGNAAQNQFIKYSVVDMVIHLLLGLAIILTSFTIINLVNCCNLLAVVLFAVFFSNASSKFKVEKRQIVVALIICVGILIFNYFGVKDHNASNKPFTLWSGLLMIFVLILEGYRPELASQIRQKYSPPPSLMYYEVTKYSFFFLIIASIVTLQGWHLMTFLWSHDRLALDLMLVAILNTVGTIFVYRIIVLHQQHVVPMLTTVRKLCTSVFNIYFFNHQIMGMQYLGLGLVAVTILTELYISYRLNSEKFNQVETQDQPYLG